MALGKATSDDVAIRVDPSRSVMGVRLSELGRSAPTQYGEGRRCAHCSARLSRYNPGDACRAHPRLAPPPRMRVG